MAGLLLLALLFIAGCSDNDPNHRYNYLRAAADFSVDTSETGALCDEPGPNFETAGFDPVETCRKLKKFVLRWERPEETTNFREYRLYLDTNPAPSKPWKSIQGNPNEATVIILETSKAEDELVFFLYDRSEVPPGIRASPKPDTLYPGVRRIFGFDTSGRMDEKDGRYVFALATHFESDGAQGQPQYTYIITHDKVPPNPFKPLITIGSRTLEVTWARPNDPTSFFDPGQDTGIINGYFLTIRLSGKNRLERSARFSPKIEYRMGGVDRTGEIKDTSIIEADKVTLTGLRYFLPDGDRAHRGTPGPADSLKVVLSNLAPQDTFDIILYARDSSGNDNRTGMPDYETVILTDTTQPTMPDLEVVENLTTKNSFVLRWTASRDVLDAGCPDEPGAGPNCRIAEYRISRVLKKAPGEKTEAFDRRDTVIVVSQANAKDTVFQNTVRFLPPGKTYLIGITAVDVSGYVSARDSIEVSTRPVVFSDSTLACPSGFIPIPAARFLLGDTSDAAQPDEGNGLGNGVRMVEMGSFCIEPYEHRDSLGNFMTKVTWEEADAVCRSMSADSTSTQLCSEAQWERACEGFDPANPHPHGIQSEQNPGILQASCNQATGDFAMAMSFELRNPICLTNEGVHDMAGNLSEWVRDPYNPKAYEIDTDSVFDFDHTFPPPDTGNFAHSIRGGNYLRPNLATAKAQELARCSNRDFPMQVRPRFREDCVDSTLARIAVVYASGMDGFTCFELPDTLRNRTFIDVLPHRDSTKVNLFQAGASRAIELKIPEKALRPGKKPLEVRFTPLSLAVVVFQNVSDPSRTITDTLDALEMRDTSQAALEKILSRESPSAAWIPRQENGRYLIRKLYAHTLGGSQVAKAYYASRNIGFRCCSKPVAKAAPPAMAGNP